MIRMRNAMLKFVSIIVFGKGSYLVHCLFMCYVWNSSVGEGFDLLSNVMKTHYSKIYVLRNWIILRGKLGYN